MSKSIKPKLTPEEIKEITDLVFLTNTSIDGVVYQKGQQVLSVSLGIDKTRLDDILNRSLARYKDDGEV
jgi:fructose-specific phosphotransferase system component IIB